MKSRNFATIESNITSEFSSNKFNSKNTYQNFYGSKTFFKGANNSNQKLKLKNTNSNLFYIAKNKNISSPEKTIPTSNSNTYYKTNSFTPSSTRCIFTQRRTLKEKTIKNNIRNSKKTVLSIKNFDLMNNNYINNNINNNIEHQLIKNDNNINNNINKEKIKYIFNEEKRIPKDLLKQKINTKTNDLINKIGNNNQNKKNIFINSLSCPNIKLNKQNQDKDNTKKESLPKNIQAQNPFFDSYNNDKDILYNLKGITNQTISSFKNPKKKGKGLLNNLSYKNIKKNRDLNIQTVKNKKLNNNIIMNNLNKNINYDLKSNLEIFDPMTLDKNNGLYKDFFQRNQKEKIYNNKLKENNNKFEELISNLDIYDNFNKDENSNIKINKIMKKQNKSSDLIKSEENKEKNLVDKNEKNILNKFNNNYIFNNKNDNKNDNKNNNENDNENDNNNKNNNQNVNLSRNEKKIKIMNRNNSNKNNNNILNYLKKNSFSKSKILSKNKNRFNKPYLKPSDYINDVSNKIIEKFEYLKKQKDDKLKYFSEDKKSNKEILTENNYLDDINDFRITSKYGLFKRNKNNFGFTKNSQKNSKKNQNKYKKYLTKNKKDMDNNGNGSIYEDNESKNGISYDENDEKEYYDYNSNEDNQLNKEIYENKNINLNEEKGKEINEISKNKNNENNSISKEKNKRISIKNFNLLNLGKKRQSLLSQNPNFKKSFHKAKNKKGKNKNKKRKKYEIKKFDILFGFNVEDVGDEIIFNHEFKNINISDNLKLKLFENNKKIFELINKESKTENDYYLLNLSKKRVKYLIKKFIEQIQKENLTSNSKSNPYLPSNIEDRKKLYKYFRSIEFKIRQQLINNPDQNEEYTSSSESESKYDNLIEENIFSFFPIDNKENNKKKDLIFDNMYLYQENEEKKSPEIKKVIYDILNEKKIEKKDKRREEIMTPGQTSIIPRNSKSKFLFRKKKFVKKLENKYNLKKIEDEKIEINEEDKDEIYAKEKRRENLDKRLNNFFNKIKQLKKGKIEATNYEEEFSELMMEQLDKNNYEEDRIKEIRIMDFFKHFQTSRINEKSERDHYNKKLIFYSPINFTFYPKMKKTKLFSSLSE